MSIEQAAQLLGVSRRTVYYRMAEEAWTVVVRQQIASAIDVPVYVVAVVSPLDHPGDVFLGR